MFGLTPLGVIHTAVSLVAVAAGLFALVRDKEITPKNTLGKIYVVTTVITSVTALGIYQHDGFGKPHVLAILTLILLDKAWVAGYTQLFGTWSRCVETVCYTMTMLFHLIPATIETATRLPLGAPLLSDPEAPQLQAASGAWLLLFLIVATLQVRRLRAAGPGNA